MVMEYIQDRAEMDYNLQYQVQQLIMQVVAVHGVEVILLRVV